MDPMDLKTKLRSIGFDADENGQSRQVQHQIPIHLYIYFEIVILFRPSPHQDWGRARNAGNRFTRDGNEPGPSWGKQLPGERRRETAETRQKSPQPSRRVRRKGAAPLSGAEEQITRAISVHAQCAPPLFFSKWECKLD
jgi:hypothetical protein